MQVAFVSSEIAPFAKVGGLADVSAALPQALAQRGHDVRVFAPLYRRARAGDYTFEKVEGLESLEASFGPHRVPYSIKTSVLPGTDLKIYFVDCPPLYDREGIYTNDPDEHLRYVTLCYAAMNVCQHMGFSPDIVHANDWQTGLLPLILNVRMAWDRQRFAKTKTVFTIHNLAHQGAFGANTLADTGLEDAANLFHQDQLNAGVINYMLTGILYASAVTTVSPTYAKEIQRDETGGSLAGFLRARSESVVGILNGIDANEWNPDDDAHVDHPYSADSLDGKEKNKRQLLEELGLTYDPKIPVAGIVTRLTWQKGIELVLEALPPLLAEGRIRFVALGSGASNYEYQLTALQKRFPQHVCFYRGFSNRLAHRIEAGADMFLMPSRFEPCGLNQMYSLRYGTVPVVRNTGGLADTVQTFSPTTRQGTGFVFEHATGGSLLRALQAALSVWPHRELWRQLQLNGMRQDFTWNQQVARYESLYRQLLSDQT
ncbi:MAG: glycogen synthase GlgA [Myxococcota bacterium]